MSPTVSVHARWDDADRFGHVNNAAYLALLRDATDRALPGSRELDEIEISFRRPLAPRADAEVAVDVKGGGDESQLIEYRLSGDGEENATATARWRIDEREARALPPLEHDAGGKLFSFTHDVRSYEIAPDGALRPVAALQWFEHAVYRAADIVGWTAARMRDADFVTLQAGHHLVLGRHPIVGERLAIVSRIVEMRRVSGTWHHEARRADGSIVAADRSRGAFLDLAGNVRRPPADMIAALLRGEGA